MKRGLQYVGVTVLVLLMRCLVYLLFVSTHLWDDHQFCISDAKERNYTVVPSSEREWELHSDSISRSGFFLPQKWLTPTPIAVKDASVRIIPETTPSATIRPVLHTDSADTRRFIRVCQMKPLRLKRRNPHGSVQQKRRRPCLLLLTCLLRLHRL